MGSSVLCRSSLISTAGLTFLLITLSVNRSNAQPAQSGTPGTSTKPAEAPRPPPVKLGLSTNDPKAFQGYTLLATQNSKTSYLIDMQGRVVRKWEAGSNPALSAYLLENGHLLRPASLNGEEMVFGGGPGAGGRVQEFDWDGNVVWDFKLLNEKQLPHHDVMKLPNGNVVLIVWDKKSPKEALAAGRKPELVGAHLLPDRKSVV